MKAELQPTARRLAHLARLALLPIVVGLPLLAPRPAPARAAHADAPTHHLYLPLVHVHPPPLPSRTLNVPADFATVAAALAAAHAGDVVRLAAGTYPEYGLSVPDGVTLRGAGWRKTVLWRATDPGEPGRVSYILALGSDTVVEGLEIGTDEPQTIGISVFRSGRHTVRGVKFLQFAIGLSAGCRATAGCVADVDVSGSLFLNCYRAILADAEAALTADHLTIRGGDTGALIRRPRSSVTNSIFDGPDIGIDVGPIVSDGNGVIAHHNLFTDVAHPNLTWLEMGEGDIVADALLAPMDWWPTPLSPARHAASDGSDIGALPFAGIGAPPTGLQAQRGTPPVPGAVAPWVVSWTGVPNAWIYHVVASPASGGAPYLRYTYADATAPGGEPTMVLDWLEPDRAYWVTVSTAYFAVGESEAAEPVYVPADGG